MDEDLELWPQEDCFSVGTATTFEEQSPYGRLSRETNEIRLVEVLPGASDEPIHCRIQSFALDEAPKYTALSYTWGRPDRDCTIRLNGLCVKVRKNLLRFLHQVRESQAYRQTKFWIDALCIHQLDSQERTHQVGLMAKIYSNAAQVLVWLGPGYANGDLALKALHRINPRDSRLDKFWSKPEGSGLRRVCERSYWTRLWVLQELVLAKEVILLCGAEQLPWMALYKFLEDVKARPTPRRRGGSLESEATIKSFAMSMVIQTQQARSLNSMYNQMLGSAHLVCSEPRDKIFALLGIVDRGNEIIHPDYSIDIPSLLNTVLRNQHGRATPKSLLGVKEQCCQLAGAMGAELDFVFASEETLRSQQIELGSQFPALVDEESGISFWWALQYGHKTVQCLWHQKNGTTPLQHALAFVSRYGEEEKCRLLLETGFVDPEFGHRVRDRIYDRHDPLGNPLTAASSKGHTNIVKLLLQFYRGFPDDNTLETAAKYAAINNHLETMLYLLDLHVSSPVIWNMPFFPCLELAARRGHECLLKGLFQNAHRYIFEVFDVASLQAILIRQDVWQYANIRPIMIDGIRALRRLCPEVSFSRILHSVIVENRTESFNLLLNNNLVTGQELNSIGQLGTLLISAIRHGNTEAACQLVHRGDVDVNQSSPCVLSELIDEDVPFETESRASPLAYAIRCRDLKVVQALATRQDLSINASGLASYPILEIAISDRHQAYTEDPDSENCVDMQIMETLLRRPDLDVSAITSQGKRPLQLAIEQGNSILIKMLLARNDLDINQRATSGAQGGRTALMLSTDLPDITIMELLLRREDLQVNMVDESGYSALSLTVCKLFKDGFDALIADGRSSLNWKDDDAISLLLCADLTGDPDWIRRVLRVKGFQPDVQEKIQLQRRWPLLYDEFFAPEAGTATPTPTQSFVQRVRQRLTSKVAFGAGRRQKP